MSDRKTILYIGGFALPDKNAAAQRVIAIGKALRDLGYEVIFVNQVAEKENSQTEEKEYFGFKTIEIKKPHIISYLTSIKSVVRIIKEKKIYGVIAYNYPSVAENRLIKYCRLKGIPVIGDITEWYQHGGNFLFRTIKKLDTSYRMKVVNLRLNGIIAISQYLYDYYSHSVHTVKIPPLVDVKDDKWKHGDKKEDIIRFVYAGSPSGRKERLDIIVDAFNKMPADSKVRLDIVGITKEKYQVLYENKAENKFITFHGLLPHNEAVRIVAAADWSIIIRENTLAVKAGFPTKVVESIACGVPVIANRFSNIYDYLNSENSIMVQDVNDIYSYISKAIGKKMNVTSDLFDYRYFISDFDSFMRNL